MTTDFPTFVKDRFGGVITHGAHWTLEHGVEARRALRAALHREDGA